MLNKIKSIFFSRNIFTFINERRKLYIIKYNKSLQKLIHINIINYKIFGGKIKIKETKDAKEDWKIYNAFNYNIICEGEYLNGKKQGIAKEYYLDGKLLFEGEYLNGKRNGTGKVYNSDKKLLFEGEFLNGKRNGSGKLYYSDGKLLSEGEYLKGKVWNVKEYDKNGNIIGELKDGKGNLIIYNKLDIKIFEGEYINGLLNGKGKEYYNNGILKYEGEYTNNLRNGKGKGYYLNGTIHFEGEYLYGKIWNITEYGMNKNVINVFKEGKGYRKQYYQFNNLFCESENISGLKNGKGKEYYNNGKLKFEGEYINGNRNGKGKIYNKNSNLIFEGEFLYNQLIKGKVYINGKLEYEGEYLYNRKYNGKGYDEKGNIVYELNHGFGKVKEYYFNNDQLYFEGEYKDGKKSGYGKVFYNNGILGYEGELLNDKPNGKGKEYYYGNGVLKYEGHYLNGKENGKGKEYFNNGKLRYEGQYLNGEKNGHGKEYNMTGDLIFEGEFLKGKRVEDSNKNI